MINFKEYLKDNKLCPSDKVVAMLIILTAHFPFYGTLSTKDQLNNLVTLININKDNIRRLKLLRAFVSWSKIIDYEPVLVVCHDITLVSLPELIFNAVKNAIAIDINLIAKEADKVIDLYKHGMLHSREAIDHHYLYRCYADCTHIAEDYLKLTLSQRKELWNLLNT